MHLLNLVTFSFFFAAGTTTLDANENADLAIGEQGKRIVDWVKAFESTGFSGAVIAGRDGKVIAAVGAGYADLENKIRVTPSTLFELASITKPITAIGVMRLVEQKKLALDDSIAVHLPDVPENCRAVTIRHLLQHTSGIVDASTGDDELHSKFAVAEYLKGGPAEAPGTKFGYWNQGYALLSEIVARSSGKDYTEFLRQEAFQPAGMKSTCFTGDEKPPGAIVAMGRSIFESPRSALDHPYGAYDLRYRGMGGVVSNVWDLWRLNRALDEHSLLSKSATSELFAIGKGDYALGWFVLTNRRGRQMHYHSGFVRGFVSVIVRLPESNSFIAVLSNREDVDVHGMAADIEELLLDKQPIRKRPPNPLQTAMRTALVGSYQADKGQKCTIEVDGEATRILIEWSPPNGPATHATLGEDDLGNVLICEPAANTELKVNKDTTNPRMIRSLELGSLKFDRTP